MDSIARAPSSAPAGSCATCSSASNCSRRSRPEELTLPGKECARRAPLKSELLTDRGLAMFLLNLEGPVPQEMTAGPYAVTRHPSPWCLRGASAVTQILGRRAKGKQPGRFRHDMDRLVRKDVHTARK